MLNSNNFNGPLSNYIKGFLEEKRNLGFKYEEQERLLIRDVCCSESY